MFMSSLNTLYSQRQGLSLNLQVLLEYQQPCPGESFPLSPKNWDIGGLLSMASFYEGPRELNTGSHAALLSASALSHLSRLL